MCPSWEASCPAIIAPDMFKRPPRLELPQYYFDVAVAIMGVAGLVPDVIALFLALPSQAKALPNIDTPNNNRIATNTFFMVDLHN